MKRTSFYTGARLCTHHDEAQISKLVMSFSYHAMRFVTYIVDSNSRRHEGFVHESGQKSLGLRVASRISPCLSFLDLRDVRKGG
jgi:hypothetical protein